MKKLDTEEFICRASERHFNKYDYSDSIYKTSHTKIKIICPIHGIFWQSAISHLNGRGCKKCGYITQGLPKSNTKDFIRKSKVVHGNKYDYSKVEYKTAKIKVIIICKNHGNFLQTPSNHLKGHGCHFCKMKLLKERTVSNHSRRKMRLSAIKRIERNCKNQILPNFNPMACNIIDIFGKENGYNFQHAMNGGEFYIKELGYWVDGYDKDKNVVIEIDEKKHFKNGNLRKKDLIRQNEIEEFLKCKFIRFNI